METHDLVSLAVVMAAAVAAVLIADVLRFLPSVVLEIVLGIVIGPQVLHLASVSTTVDLLSWLGLSFLLFLAGFEIDLQKVRGRPLTLAVLGWVVSLGLALGIAALLVVEGLVLSDLLVGLALTTTALGTLLPILKDKGVVGTSLGPYVLGAGTLGEFGPIVAVAVLLSGNAPARSTLLLIAFVVVTLAAAALTLRVRPPRMLRLVRTTMHTSGQLAVRVAVLLLVVLLVLAAELGLDVLLGAFAAGVILRLATGADDARLVTSKLEAIGFGFLIPVFFVATGMGFDIRALVGNASALLRLPLFLGLFLLVRGLPTLLYRKALGGRDRWSLAFFSATGLPLIVVITSIGLETGRMLPENAAALVGAGMLSVMVFPLVGLKLRRERGHEPAAAASEGAAMAPRSAGEPRAAVPAGGGAHSPRPLDEPAPFATDKPSAGLPAAERGNPDESAASETE